MSSILNELKQEIKETTKYFKFLIEAQKKKKKKTRINDLFNEKPEAKYVHPFWGKKPAEKLK